MCQKEFFGNREKLQSLAWGRAGDTARVASLSPQGTHQSEVMGSGGRNSKLALLFQAQTLPICLSVLLIKHTDHGKFFHIFH